MQLSIQERMRQPEAAAHLGLSQSTLAKLRVLGSGPTYIKAGRAVVYDRADLNTWLDARKRNSTSEPPNSSETLQPTGRARRAS